MSGVGRTLLPSVALSVGIFLLRLAVDDPGQGILFLMVIPIALLGVEYKVTGGLLGAGIGALALVGWMTIEDVALGAIGVTTRLACFLVAGLGVGLLAAQSDRRASRLRELETRSTRHDAALTVHEQIIQSLAVAKLGLEMGDPDRAATALEEALKSAQSFVSAGVEVEPGTFRAGS